MSSFSGILEHYRCRHDAVEGGWGAPTTLRSCMMLFALLPLTPSCLCISNMTQSVLAKCSGGSWNRNQTAMLWRLSHPVLHSQTTTLTTNRKF